MRLYTAHAARDDLVLVPEGGSFVATILPLPWLLWHRCWLAALGYVIAALAIGLLAPDGFAPWIGLAAHLLIGLSAQDIRRWTLARRGQPVLAVVAGYDRDTALFRLLAERHDLVKGTG